MNKTIEADTVGVQLNYLESFHNRKTVNDLDASLTEYILSNPNRPDSIHTTIYLLPFGNMKPEVEQIISNEIDYLETFFQMPVKILPRITFDEVKQNAQIKTRFVPDSDYGYYEKMKGGAENLREQIEASSFMNKYMIDQKPEDAVAVLGITEHDIYNSSYNFLFGSSSTKNGVGLISTFRLIDYGKQTKYNIRKVVSKQIVNLFSIRNVKDYECLLNFHNSKEELELGEFKLSPRALEKFKYNIGFDYNKRFKELEQIWLEEGNKSLSEYYQKCQK
ncbi:hypothetical protein [Parvicella tangerina]|nr:hypothetical protein [Parvicella tangerina]